MRTDEKRPQLDALIPWVFALVALLGLNALCGDYARSRRNEAADGVGLSLECKNLETAGRVSNPLVLDPPSPDFETAKLDPGVPLARPEIVDDVEAATMRRGAVQGRAPPAVA